MKLISKISLFFICCTGTNILFGQDAYFGDLDPGSDAPPFHSPNRPSTYEHPNDNRNLEAALRKYNGERIWVEINASPRFNKKNDTTQYL